MKKLFSVLLLVLSLSACHSISIKNKTDPGLVYDIDMKIVAVNYESSLSNDKFQSPQLCNAILFETVTGPKLYREINTCKMGPGYGNKFNIDTKWIYNHKVGDIVHFDYLMKSKFFEITR